MDRNNLDQSPPYSDTNGGSWVQCWDTEDSSITGLNLGEFLLFLRRMEASRSCFSLDFLRSRTNLVTPRKLSIM